MAADGDTATQAAKAAGPRKRMQVFKGADGRDMAEGEMPWEGVDESVQAGFARLMQAGATAWPEEPAPSAR